MSPPMVSISMATYNHERHISQAIESVLAQKTDFECELIIGEDCSPDGTRAICEKYAREHPGRIRLLPAERNLGMHLNGRRLLKECRGRYIAFLDGDDHWTDPRKLQRQMDYLESHPECAMVCGAARVVCVGDGPGAPADGSLQPFPFPPADTTIRDLARFGGYVMTPTCLIRNWLGEGVPDWVFTCPIVDWAMNMMAALQGSIHFDERVVAAYRVHSGGVWSRQTSVGGAYALWKTFRILSRAPELAAVFESEPDLADEWNRRVIRNLKGELVGRVANGGRFGPGLREILRRDAPEFRLNRAERRALSRAVFEDAFYALFRSRRHRKALRMALRILWRDPAWWCKRSSLGAVWAAGVQAVRTGLPAS